MPDLLRIIQNSCPSLLTIYINCTNGKSIRKALKRVSEYFCKLLNDRLDCHAEPQKTWYRIPGSINTKDRSVVHVQHVSDERFTVQELLSEYLPSLPVAKRKKARPKPSSMDQIVVSHKGNVFRIHSNRTLQLNRLHDYQLLRSVYGIPRETLLFLYGVAWLQLHEETSSQLLDALFDFNKGFSEPLTKKEITSKFRTLPDLMRKSHYRFKNTTIMNWLGLSEENCQNLGLTLHTDAKTRKRLQQIQAGTTCKQNQQRRYEQVRQLYCEKKLKAGEIAQLLNCSKSTVEADITKIRKAIKETPAENNTLPVNELKETADFQHPGQRSCTPTETESLQATG